MSDYLPIEKIDCHVGEKVSICGIVESSQNHGGLIFIELNDLFNSVKALVIPDTKDVFSLASTIDKGYIVSISGVVKACPVSSQKENPLQKIEIEVEKLKIISRGNKISNVIKISEGHIPSSLRKKRKIV